MQPTMDYESLCQNAISAISDQTLTCKGKLTREIFLDTVKGVLESEKFMGSIGQCFGVDIDGIDGDDEDDEYTELANRLVDYLSSNNPCGLFEDGTPVLSSCITVQDVMTQYNGNQDDVMAPFLSLKKFQKSFDKLFEVRFPDCRVSYPRLGYDAEGKVLVMCEVDTHF